MLRNAGRLSVWLRPIILAATGQARHATDVSPLHLEFSARAVLSGRSAPLGVAIRSNALLGYVLVPVPPGPFDVNHDGVLSACDVVANTRTP